MKPLFIQYIFGVNLLFCFYTSAQNTFVPDDNFEQALIDLGLDTGPLNDAVPTANILTVEELTLSALNISDLTGIEAFTAPRQLFVENNALTAIDVSFNTDLQLLWCHNNRLPNLDVSNNTKLTSLRCENNNLTALDVFNNTSLLDLICDTNNISNLNTLNNPTLRRLSCGNNLLDTLDVSLNTNLFVLTCENNTIAELTIANSPNLNTLNCSNNAILQLDASLNSNLINLNCSSNNLCFLNLNNANNSNLTALNFEDNPNLQCVIVDLPNVNRTGWFPTSFSGYVAALDDCDAQIPVDRLDTVFTTSFTLPPLTNGNYFTAPEGNGNPLNVGDEITTGQTIYIFNENGCFTNESNFSVIISNAPYFIPKFFTPNNDGINDQWRILDTENLVNNISIYNRYGKLLKFLSSPNESWDGTFNNQFLPNDSYWYEIVLNTKDVVRGYFALKR